MIATKARLNGTGAEAQESPVMPWVPPVPSFRSGLLVLILLVVIPALGIALYGNFQQRGLERARVCEQAAALSRLAAAGEENFIDETRQLLATLTQFPFLLLGTNKNFCEGNFSNLRKLSPDYANFGLVETNGMLFCGADPTPEPVSHADRPYFQQVMQTGKFAVGNFRVGRVTGRAVLNFGYPVKDEHGQLARVLYAALKVTRLSDALMKLELPTGSSVTVLDRRGNILARQPSPAKWVGKSLSSVPAVGRLLTTNGGDFEMEGIDKVPRYYAVTAIGDGQKPSLFVTVEVPLTVLYAKANVALERNFLLLGAIAFAIWFAVRFYARRFFLRPIGALAGAAERLAQADLSARAGTIQGPAELVQLGRALDQMAEGVQERTAQLLESNNALREEIAERERAEQHAREQEQEKKKLEEQFLRSQRMDSIGALAGGIAHDLNNALVPVLLGSQILREEESDAEERRKLLDLIITSGKRCTDMVRQILSFARGTRHAAGTVPVRQVMAEMAKIARETFPKAIRIETHTPRDLWDVEGDATELHQILMNLCVNSRDAMPQGGTLQLTAENIKISASEQEAHPGIRAGSYVLLTVTDSGNGMTAEVRERIFEPFFTTKTPEKGTGLGLSTVAILVKRHKGSLKVESEPGKGTEFRVYLPASVPAAAPAPEAQEVQAPAGHGELILFADDEQMVLEIAKTTLESYGYRVLAATNGLQAIASFEAHKNEIKLVVTDTDMPFLDGVSAAQAMRRICPSISIIMTSATAQDTTHLKRSDLSGITSLPKPYGVQDLLNCVGRLLAESVNRPEGNPPQLVEAIR